MFYPVMRDLFDHLKRVWLIHGALTPEALDDIVFSSFYLRS